jgi:hypothetical protein
MRIIMSGEEEKVKNKAVFRSNYFKVLSHNSPGNAEMNFRDPQPE